MCPESMYFGHYCFKEANMDNIKKKEYELYFEEILKELEREFEKSNLYSEKIDSEIKKFEELMPNKGTQYFLIEHLKNAVALQSQRQSIIKDKFAIKKAVLDYVMKDNKDEAEGKILFEELTKIVQADKEKLKSITDKVESTMKKQEDIDQKIDEILDKSEEE
jgi:hypothetical protein